MSVRFFILFILCCVDTDTPGKSLFGLGSIQNLRIELAQNLANKHVTHRASHAFDTRVCLIKVRPNRSLQRCAQLWCHPQQVVRTEHRPSNGDISLRRVAPSIAPLQHLTPSRSRHPVEHPSPHRTTAMSQRTGRSATHLTTHLYRRRRKPRRGTPPNRLPIC